MTGVPCEWCGGLITDGSTCPRSLECPSCHAQPGGPCRRPSGHNCDIHVDRIKAAQAIDDERKAGP